MRLISTDTFRLGGTDLLRRYAEAMGVAFETPSNLDALHHIATKDERGCLTLIDTPGLSEATPNQALLLVASSLSGRTSKSILVAVLRRWRRTDPDGRSVQILLPSKALFTGLDNCSNVGPLLAFSLQRETPISFLGTGPEVPDDLEEATAGSLTARLLPSLMDAIVTAA